jgi:phosphoribosyl 1,2-cyclic phosphodiesterase
MEIKVLASGSSGNAYFVSDGKTPVLLEAGIPFSLIKRGLNFHVSRLAACLISHEHSDHARAAAKLMKAGIDCYMSRGTAAALKLSGHRLPGHRLRIIQALTQFHIGTWAIKPFEAHHDAAEPLCFLMADSSHGKLLFATDTAYVAYRFQGLTHLMIEANYSAPLLKDNTRSSELRRSILQDHMSLETLIKMLRANDLSKVQEIHLLHLSDNNSNAERFKQRIQEITGKPVYIG